MQISSYITLKSEYSQNNIRTINCTVTFSLKII